MSRAVASRAVTIVALVLSAVAGALAIGLDIAVLTAHPSPPVSPGWSGVLPGLAMLIPGSLLLWRLPWHPIALVLTGFGTLWVVDGLAAAAVNAAWFGDRGVWWAGPAFWFYTRFGSVLILPIVLLLLLFPEGRLPRGAWRVVSIAALVLGLVMPFAFLFAPPAALGADDGSRIELLDAFPPLGITLPGPLEVWTALLFASGPALAVSVALSLAVCIGRRFSANVVERAQLRWLVWSGLIFVAMLAFVFPVVPAGVVDVLLSVTIGLISGSIVIAVTRYRLYDIDRLLSWTLVYGMLIAGIVLVDVAIIVVLGSAIDDRVAMLLAVVAVTIIYTPIRGRLFAVASRLVSGRRGDPYAVVSSLGDRLDRAVDARGRLQEVADAVSEAFGSRYVRVELYRPDTHPLVAVHGDPVADATAVQIDHDGAVIGQIFIEPGRRPLVSSRDQRLLGDLVRLAAASLRNAELGRELQAIRERLVLTREEERSRLRRDLHDGLGPLLAGVKLRLEAARNLAARDPQRSIALVDAAIEDQSAVIEEIRRIVQDLRPPALDDLGLRGALAQQATRLSGGGVTVSVLGDAPVGLAPAVEVAAFRIASEAMTNARRHSGAARIQVSLEHDSRALDICVRDDGSGIRQSAPAGVGLRSQRERAAELGGTLEVGPSPEGGTVVRARLPLPPTVPADARAIEEPDAGDAAYAPLSPTEEAIADVR